MIIKTTEPEGGYYAIIYVKCIPARAYLPFIDLPYKLDNIQILADILNYAPDYPCQFYIEEIK